MTVRVKSNAWRGIRDNPNPHQGLAALNLGHQAWRKDAACAEVSWEFFFCDEKGEQGCEAKSICARCPVIDQCLEYALDNNEKYGIWAGRNSKQLAKIRRERAVDRDKKSTQDHETMEATKEDGPGGVASTVHPGPTTSSAKEKR